MSKLSFEFDWLDAGRSKGAELAATWASLRIQAGDAIITRALDERAKTVRSVVYVPLYPLAEWLASNWWFITRERHNPVKDADPDFHIRHSIAASREGYAFPDLEIIPAGSRTRIAWKGYLSRWTRIRFLEQAGDMWVDSGEFAETCADLIDSVIRRLDSFDIEDTFLQEEWEAIQTADEDESQFCEVAAGLGWDPYSVDDYQRDRVLSLHDQLGAFLGEATSALDAGALDREVRALSGAIAEAGANSIPLESLEAFRVQHALGGGLTPWEEGYDMARRFRRGLGLDGEPLATIAQVADALGEDAELIEKATSPVEQLSGTPLIDGVVTRDGDERPAFAFRRLGEDARRFHFCRSLAEVLTSPGSDSLITRARSERQQRNRAFAAEFLAPSSGLERMVSRPVVDGSDIDEMATKFGVSSRVVEYQLRNHRIAAIWGE